MFRIDGIYSLTDFQRNARTHLDRLKQSGQPEILTVNGQAEIVVQDATAYQAMVDKLEAIEGIRKGLASVKQGKGRNIEAFFEEFEHKHAIERFGMSTARFNRCLRFRYVARWPRKMIYFRKKSVI